MKTKAENLYEKIIQRKFWEADYHKMNMALHRDMLKQGRAGDALRALSEAHINDVRVKLLEEMLET